MNVFLGITGASGAPYAARLLDALVAADVAVGLSTWIETRCCAASWATGRA